MNFKRFFSVAVAALFFFSPVVTAQAVTEEEAAAEAEARRQAIYDTEPETNSLPDWPQGPKVNAASAIVMDMESGAILYGKKVDEVHYPASITKLLTALVALENSDLLDLVTFSQESVDFLEYGDAHIGMKPGEQIYMNDALYAVLLASANEVAYAVAENVGIKMGGNYDTFIQKMNERTAELGCTNSHWMNPHGLHDEQHYTTAHDMALIASAVYQYEDFRRITQTLEYHIGMTNLTNEERVFQQNHDMLWLGNENYYAYCTGGKTGYTDQAGTTLVTMADNGSMHLAAVVLADYGKVSYTDTRAMMDYVFTNFEKVPLSEAGVPGEIKTLKDPDAYVVLPKGADISRLTYEIQAEGDQRFRADKVVCLYEGQKVGKADVILQESYFAEKEEGTDEQNLQFGKSEQPSVLRKETKEENLFFGKISFFIAGGIIVAGFLCYLFYIHRERSRQRKRREERRKILEELREERRRGDF